MNENNGLEILLTVMILAVIFFWVYIYYAEKDESDKTHKKPDWNDPYQDSGKDHPC